MIFVRALTSENVKLAIIKGYVKNNEFNSSVKPSALTSIDAYSESEGMVVDNVTGNAIFFTKLDIAKLIDPNIDITPFNNVDPSTFQLETLTPAQVDEYNQSVDQQILSTYEYNFSSLTNYDMDTLKKYAVFCRLTGFFALDVSDVDLFSEEGSLVISVRPTNKLYMGKVTVKTW